MLTTANNIYGATQCSVRIYILCFCLCLYTHKFIISARIYGVVFSLHVNNCPAWSCEPHVYRVYDLFSVVCTFRVLLYAYLSACACWMLARVETFDQPQDGSLFNSGNFVNWGHYLLQTNLLFYVYHMWLHVLYWFLYGIGQVELVITEG